MKIKLDLSHYAMKAYLNNATGVNTTKFAKKIDLANLNSDADKLDIEKLKNGPTNLNNLKNNLDKLGADKSVPVPVDLSKLSDVLKMMLLKKICIKLRSNILKIKYHS